MLEQREEGLMKTFKAHDPSQQKTRKEYIALT
jgi:hypothetical protein